jgi:hypothetical protein
VRIRLLAWSYLAACEAAAGDSTSGETISLSSSHGKTPSRNHELWRYGSYGALERAVDSLPPYVKLRFWVFYVRDSGPFDHAKTYHSSLGRVSRMMPKFIYVPADISQAAGFLKMESEEASRG